MGIEREIIDLRDAAKEKRCFRDLSQRCVAEECSAWVEGRAYTTRLGLTDVRDERPIVRRTFFGGVEYEDGWERVQVNRPYTEFVCTSCGTTDDDGEFIPDRPSQGYEIQKSRSVWVWMKTDKEINYGDYYGHCKLIK